MECQKAELTKAFPSFLASDIESLLAKVRLSSKLSSIGSFQIYTCGELIIVPERIYYEPEVSYSEELLPLESLLLSAYFTRHHDGYVRERELKKIISFSNTHNWVIPYLMRLLGEYVIEILYVIKKNVAILDTALIKDFIHENPEFYKLTEDRVATYWGLYYKNQFPKKEDYVGFQILQYIRSL